MASPYNGRDSSPTGCLMPPCQASRFKDGPHLVKSLSKEVPEAFPNRPYRLLPRLLVVLHNPESKILLLKTQLPYVIEHGEIKLVLN